MKLRCVKLHSGAKIDKPAKKGQTALIVAASEGHLETVNLLLDLGADVDLEDDLEKTALHYAVKKEGGQLSILEALVTSDRDKSTLSAQDAHGMTPLHMAAEAGNLAAVEFLVEAGASLMSKNFMDNMPIHCAVEAEHPEIIKYFLKTNRSLINASGLDDLKPLVLACQNDKPKAAEALLKYGGA